MKAAIWARVSGDTQNASNQLYELRQWAQARGLEIAAEFVTEDSAWTKKNGNGMKGAEFDVRRNDMLEGARLGKYEVVLCWGLDRLSRRGAEDMLSYVRRLTDTGCRLWSLKDPWAESTADPMTRELLFSVFATIARFESERRSERIKAGIERRRREGKPIGGATTRKGHGKGSRHSGERKSAAWTDARRAALVQRNKERAAARRRVSEKREKGSEHHNGTSEAHMAASTGPAAALRRSPRLGDVAGVASGGERAKPGTAYMQGRNAVTRESAMEPEPEPEFLTAEWFAKYDPDFRGSTPEEIAFVHMYAAKRDCDRKATQ